MTDHEQTVRSVIRLGQEQPKWIPILQGAVAQARKAERFGGEFAGTWVLDELEAQTGERPWVPGLRVLSSYGLIEKSGPSTRGGRRAYYRMPDPDGVEEGLRRWKELES